MTREEAIDVLKHNYPSTCFTDLCEAVDIAIQALSVQPESKRGKWITEVKHYKDESQNFYYEHTRCSICGAKKRIGWYDANYCPRCGARMESESE